MKAGMAYIEPILAASGAEPLGRVVMGTVKGDLNDIGKNLCIMMLRPATSRRSSGRTAPSRPIRLPPHSASL